MEIFGAILVLIIVLYVFRRPESPIAAIELDLRAIDSNATYRVVVKPDYVAPPQAQELPGAQLATLLVALAKKGAATVVEYSRIK